MSGVLFVAGSQRRRRRSVLVFVAILAGVLGGLATSLVAGASRSSSVVDRFTAAQPRIDVHVFGSGLSRDELLAVPGVSAVAPNSYVAMNRVAPDGTADDGVNGMTYDYASGDSRGMRVLSGRFPDGSDPTHIAVNDLLVGQFGLKVGDDLTVRMYGQGQGDELMNEIYRPSGPTYRFHIDAVVRQAFDVAGDEIRLSARAGIPAHQSRAYLLFPYDFWSVHKAEFLTFGEDFDVRLQEGVAGLPAFEAALGKAVAPGDESQLEPGGNTRGGSFNAPVDLETNALLGLGAALGITALLLLAVVLRLDELAHEPDADPLRAVGMTRGGLVAVAVTRVAPVAVAAGLLAAAVAVSLSGSYPIGVGRQLELDGGIQLNLAVVLAGAVLTTAAIAVISSLLVLRRQEPGRVVAHRTNLAHWLGNRGAPLAPTLGAHVAFVSSSGRRSPASRVGIVAATALVVVTAAMGIWVAGVDRFYGDPDLHGWPWDVVIGNSNFPLPPADAASLAADARFTGVTAASYGQVTVDGESVEALVVDAAGTAPLPILAGRAPHGAGEIALGGLTMRHHHLAIGSSAQVSFASSEFGSGETLDATVVGETVAPVLGESELADIEVVTYDTVAAAGVEVPPQLLLADIDPRLDRDATIADLGHELTEELTLDIVPARAVNMHRVRSLPLLGSALASMLAALILGYTVISGARSHRRELATLRAVGLERRRVRRALAWQSGLIVGAVLALGVPLGLAAGAKVWSQVARGIGISASTTVPAWLALPLAGLLATAAAVGAWVHHAQRATPVTHLRVE